MASIQERYGTEAEDGNDKQIIKSVWNRAPSAYEAEKVVILPFAQYHYFACAVGVTAPQQYKINSIYDPDLTGAGNQPLGRDTWAGIYNYYKVLETYIELSVTELTDDSTGATGTNQQPSLVTWMADLTAAPPSTRDALIMTVMANANNQQQKFGPLVVSDIINGRGSKTKHFKYKWDASQFDTSILDNGKDEWTPVGGDPDVQNYFSVIYYNPNSLSATRPVLINIQISYLTAFKQINRTLLNTVN